MRLRRTVIFISFLLMLSGFALAQDKPKAHKFAEFRVITAKSLSAKMQTFYDELDRERTSQGYIINYGTQTAIRGRRKLFMSVWSTIRIPDYDPPRVTFVDGPRESKVRTVMWIVPQGAETPVP